MGSNVQRVDLRPSKYKPKDYLAPTVGELFRDAGFSRGLGYNLFCGRHVAGRIHVMGGHDKGGTTASGRSISSTQKPSSGSRGRCPALGRSGRRTPPVSSRHCDPLNEANIDPPAPCRKSQRWYPTGVTLPDGRALQLKRPGFARPAARVRLDFDIHLSAFSQHGMHFKPPR
jgi:hypothetical protein